MRRRFRSWRKLTLHLPTHPLVKGQASETCLGRAEAGRRRREWREHRHPANLVAGSVESGKTPQPGVGSTATARHLDPRSARSSPTVNPSSSIALRQMRSNLALVQRHRGWSATALGMRFWCNGITGSAMLDCPSGADNANGERGLPSARRCSGRRPATICTR